MKKLKKVFRSYKFRVLIFIKNLLRYKTKHTAEIKSITDLYNQYAWVSKIVVLCNGPSANLFEPSNDVLYLVTNSGDKLVADLHFLYYVNDPLYIQRLLADDRFLKARTGIVFYYNDTGLHRRNMGYLIKNFDMIRQKTIYFISALLPNPLAQDNFDKFISFYSNRDLSVKVQNSGMFILLFGYFIAHHLKLPLEIYGLDMGEGGRVHFDGKGIIGNSVTDERVKKNIRRYLDFIYKEYDGKVKNYSYFYSNLNN